MSGTTDQHRGPEVPVDWLDVLQAPKDARGAELSWVDSTVAGTVVASRLRFDLVVITAQGSFTPWVEAAEDPGVNTQIRLMTHRERLKHLCITRLCCCEEHAGDEYPAHWHHFVSIDSMETQIEPVMSLPQGTITRDALLEVFVSTMQIHGYQKGMDV